ncbi:Npl6p ASCRUDRAFT_84834 [Ascoidea rubescens DSM 1968]|uniref:Nuclear localization protein n=1 Tax=Ascoidea rubescens DSM 1968 TaxID=1344418 RepID=A0A1D2VKQ4_9ASCO|nr:hypothetical protein ASCRUDRAFT_84834 [Ascoidea rubescens DSM 1968]ODV62194.1 hypothetical protein ASCRUDRAFT_84834 [Ascoidea rubescens DSM 1968]
MSGATKELLLDGEADQPKIPQQLDTEDLHDDDYRDNAASEPDQHDDDSVGEYEDDDEPVVVTPKRRRGGRPPGSKNKTTLAREKLYGPVLKKRKRLSRRLSSLQPHPHSDATSDARDNDHSGRENDNNEDNEDDVGEDDCDDDEDHDHDHDHDHDNENDHENDNDDDDEDETHSVTGLTRKRRTGRAGGFKNRKLSTPVPQVDDDGNVLLLGELQDEYILPDDPQGDTKIDSNGNLLNNREFRVRTFTVKGNGEKKYMLATEPARCVGFRDSYLLFNKYKRLYKYIISNDQKFDLIHRDLIPHSYKGRSIGLITAKSFYQVFGAKIIVGGKRVTDDYYEQKARDNGRVEGELADPTDTVPDDPKKYDKKQWVTWHGALLKFQKNSTPNNLDSLIDLQHNDHSNNDYNIIDQSKKSKTSKLLVSDPNWLYDHAVKCREYNHFLVQSRLNILNLRNGKRDPYTGINFYPSITQPTAVRYDRIKHMHDDSLIANKKAKVIYEINMISPNLARQTGLKNVDLSIFDGKVDEKTKQAILEQQNYEREWEEYFD